MCIWTLIRYDVHFSHLLSHHTMTVGLHFYSHATLFNARNTFWCAQHFLPLRNTFQHFLPSPAHNTFKHFPISNHTLKPASPESVFRQRVPSQTHSPWLARAVSQQDALFVRARARGLIFPKRKLGVRPMLRTAGLVLFFFLHDTDRFERRSAQTWDRVIHKLYNTVYFS
jgi:hypothetical protein